MSQEIFCDLKTGFEQILGRQEMSRGRYMELYSHVYNYSNPPNVLNNNIEDKGDKSSPPSEIYELLKELLKDSQVSILEVWKYIYFLKFMIF